MDEYGPFPWEDPGFADYGPWPWEDPGFDFGQDEYGPWPWEDPGFQFPDYGDNYGPENPGIGIDYGPGYGPGGSSWIDNLLRGIGGAGGLGGLLSGPLGALALGGALGGMNGSKEAGTTTVTSAPWGPQQPYLLDLFKRAKDASSATPSNDEWQSYYEGLGLSSGGARQIADTLSGSYMTPDNPLYKSIMDDALNQWNNAYMPSTMGAFYNRDQTGPLGSNSGFNQTVDQGQRTFGKALAGQLSANLFNPERQRQVAYAGMFNPTTGSQIGRNMRMDPFAVLDAYRQQISGGYGGTQTQPYYTNPAAGVLGGALAGSEIWKNLFNNTPKQG